MALSLEQMCIEIIVNNFPKFNDLFLYSQNATFKRNMKFLQKVYSNRILPLIDMDFAIKDDYADFFVNEYIQELTVNLSSLLNRGFCKQIHKIGKALEKLTVTHHSSWFEPRHLPVMETIFQRSPNLTILHVEYFCSDELLLQISKLCPNLLELSINSSTNVSDKGIRHLVSDEANVSLKVLCMLNIFVSQDAVGFLLQKMPSLEKVSYFNFPLVLYSLHKDSYINGKLNDVEPYNLTYLYFSDFEDSFDVISVCSTVCPNVTHMYVEAADEKVASVCSKFSKLQKLELYGRNYSMKNVLQNWKSNVVNLYLHYVNVSVSMIAQSFPNVKELLLNEIEFEPLHENTFFFNNLTKFTLHNTKCDVESCAINNIKALFASSTSLSELNFDHCDLSHTHFDHEFLFKLPSQSLKHLSFVATNIEISLLRNMLHELNFLETLHVDDYMGITKEDIDDLYKVANSLKNRPVLYFGDVGIMFGYDDVTGSDPFLFDADFDDLIDGYEYGSEDQYDMYSDDDYEDE